VRSLCLSGCVILKSRAEKAWDVYKITLTVFIYFTGTYMPTVESLTPNLRRRVYMNHTHYV